LEDKRGSAAAAAEAYQRGLSIDASLSDQASAGSDWFNYGQFLRRQRQPERLVFACFLRAEELVSKTPGAALTTIEQARAESEARLGREAAVVRRSAATLAKQALELPASLFSLSK
jgi:hypothetical protein